MTITITLDTDADQPSERDLRVVLQDALYEYRTHRENGDAKGYVDKRYPGNSVYAGEHRIEKISSVRKRCQLATDLHRALFRAEVS